MSDDPSVPAPPEDLPADLHEVLTDHATDVHGLQETNIYARELLNKLHESELPLEPREGEEILRVRNRPGYLEVVKRDEEEGTAYLYHVRSEPHRDGSDHLHWSLIGRVDEEEL